MAFTFDSEFIFIGRGDESFLENYSYELSDDPAASGGKIFMSLEILNNQAEAEDIGEAIFATFKQKFYEQTDIDPYDRFEAALKEANRTIETLKEEKVSRFIGNLNIAIGAISSGVLYLSTMGDADVYLIRKRFVSVLSEGLAEENNKDAFINIANGSLEPFDAVVFSSTRLLRYITKSELGKIFSGGAAMRIGAALASLSDFIMTEILGRSSVIGILVGETAEEGSAETLEFEAEQTGGVFGFLKKFLPSHETLGIIGSLLERVKNAWPEKWTPDKDTFESLGEKVSEKLPGKLFPKIRFKQGMTRERLFLGIILLLVILTAGIFWLRGSVTQRRSIQEQQAKLNTVRDIISESLTVGQFDKPKAASLLANAEQSALEVLNSRFIRSEAVKVLDDIKKQRDMLDDVKRIKEPVILADFSSKRATASMLGLLALKDRLYGFEYNALYEMVLDKLQDPLTMSDIETVILGANFPDGDSLLFLTRTGKMIEYASARFDFVSTRDGVWKKGADMKSYNDRLYILDPERNQIWKYPRQREGFSSGEAYNQNADLSKSVSLAIDTSIYVLNSDGTITQLYQGQKQEYPLRRPPLLSLTAPTKIFTNADLNRMFILEPANQRVVIFRKDSKNGGAQYQTQYVFENTGALRDLLVVDNRLYVLDDKRVYFVNLSGLL